MSDGEDRKREVPAEVQERRELRHDLRTPLTQILGYAELLADDAREAGQLGVVRDLEKIGRAARQMSELIDRAFADEPKRARPGSASDESLGETNPAELRVDEDASTALTHSDDASVPPAVPRGFRVLVVDDDPRNLEVLGRHLQRRGFDVDVASSGREALQQIARSTPDLVVLDVMMPGMSGIDVLTAIRAQHSAADLPVVMATALDQSGDIVEALQHGANDYVTKPLDIPVVLARLENQLALKAAREEVRRLAQDLEARNRIIRSTFGRFLNEDVVTALLETPEGQKLGGARRKVTVLMSDLRGFTSLADRHRAEEVMAMLNDYLGAMVEVVERHKGTIVEFIGDAIFVLFGAPFSRDDDARRAVACAIEMQSAMAQVNEWFAEAGLEPLEMGIALNTGEVIVGNIGSLKRAKYGAVGRHVNLTARIESFAVGGQILASRSTVAEAGDDVLVGATTRLHAKGFSEPVEIVEVKGLAAASLFAPETTESFVELAQPLRVRLTVLDGKFVGGREHDGAVTRVARSGAFIESTLELADFTDVRLRVAEADGAWLSDDVYGKVISPADGTGCLRVRFTSVPPGAATLFRALTAAR